MTESHLAGEPPEVRGFDGSLGRGSSLVIVLTSAIGLLASAALLVEYIRKLADPGYELGCNFSAWLTCGPFLNSWQGSAFGIPNPILGVSGFSVILTLAVVLLAGVGLPRWMWRAMVAGTAFAVIFCTWLQYQSLTSLRALCPYCLVVWAVVIPLFVVVLSEAMRNGSLPAPQGLRQFMTSSYRWIVVVLWYIVILAAIVVTLGSRILG